PGALPSDPATAEARRHVLRFDVTAEVLATFREAVARLRRDAGGGLSEDDALLLMARQVLGGPTDEGRASYQIVMNVCPRCREGAQEGRGELIPVSSSVVEMACCDAQHVGDPHVGSTRAKQDVPPSIRRLVMRRDHGRCIVAGCRSCVFCD